MTNDFSDFSAATSDELIVSETGPCGDHLMLNISMPLSVALSSTSDSAVDEPSDVSSRRREFRVEDTFITNFLSRNGKSMGFVIRDAPEFSDDPSDEDLAWWRAYALYNAKRAAWLRHDLLDYTTVEAFAEKTLPLYLAAWESQTWVNLVPCYPEEILRKVRGG